MQVREVWRNDEDCEALASLANKGGFMDRKTVRKIYVTKSIGRGYKPSRWKRPPSAKLIRIIVAKRIVSRLKQKQAFDVAL